MRVTTKGQVTIPQHIREKLGIMPSTEIDFVEKGDRVYLVKKKGGKPQPVTSRDCVVLQRSK